MERKQQVTALPTMLTFDPPLPAPTTKEAARLLGASLQPIYSRKPIDWRARRAYLLYQGQYRKDNDAEVKALLNLLRRQSGQLKPRPHYQDQFIAQAIQIHEENTQQRWALEARLLARQAPEYVAAKLNLDKWTLRWYVDLFYDLAERINAPGFVRESIGGFRPDLFSTDGVGAAWRTIGYWHGAQLLDPMIAEFRASGHQDYAYIFEDGWDVEHLSEVHRKIRKLLWHLMLPLDAVKACCEAYCAVRLQEIASTGPEFDAVADVIMEHKRQAQEAAREAILAAKQAATKAA